MEGPPSGNAITEIALSLAMGFFTIMVLTMLSMGAGSKSVSEAPGTLLASPALEASDGAQFEWRQSDVLVIYHRGRFLDRELKPISPAALVERQRVVLAVDPTLSIPEAIAVRAQIDSRDVIVSILDKRWLNALESTTNRSMTKNGR